MAKRLHDVARPLAQPFLGYFDRRFQDVHDRLESRVDQLAERVTTEVECLSEMTLGMQRFVDLCERRVDDAIAAVSQLVATVEQRGSPAAPVLGPDPSLVEVPFVVAGVADTSFPARVVLAGSHPQLALLLAYLGHSITVVGVDHLPVEHPQVSAVSVPVAQWAGPGEAADVVVSLPVEPGQLEQLGRWLHPKGQLLLSAPVGHLALEDMLAAWDVVERRCYRWADHRWQPRPDDSGGEGPSLLLVRAAPRP